MFCRRKGKTATLMMTQVSGERIPPRRIARENNTEDTVAVRTSHDQIVQHMNASCACPVSLVNVRRGQFRH